MEIDWRVLIAFISLITFILASPSVFATWYSPSAVQDSRGGESGCDATALIDGDTGAEGGWEDHNLGAHWVILDLSVSSKVTKIRVAGGKSGYSDYYMCGISEIFVCDDAACDGETSIGSNCCWEGGPNTWHEIDITDTVGRYLKVIPNITSGEACDVAENWLGSGDCGTGSDGGFYEIEFENTTADATAPIITIGEPDNTTYNTQTIWFNVTLDEDGDWCGYSMNGTSNITMTNSTGNWNNEMSNVDENHHNVSFCCNDTMGNMNCSFNTADTIRVWTIDITEPVITISSVGGDASSPYKTSDTTPDVVLTLDENGDCRASASDESYDDMSDDDDCSGDGTTSITCTLSDQGSDGSKSVYIACNDSYNNSHSSAQNTKVDFTLDTTPPVQTLSSIGGDDSSPYTTSDPTPDIVLTLDENGDCRASASDESYDDMSDDDDCSGDGTTSITCTLSDQGSDGSKSVYIACQDTDLSNKDTAATNDKYDFTLDTTPISISGDTPVNSTNYTWSSSGNELNITFSGTVDWGAYSIDEGINVSTGQVAELNTTIYLPEGYHNVTIYANDSTNNWNTSFREFNISQLSSTCTLSFNKASPQDYGTSVTPQCVVSYYDSTNGKLWRNDTDVTATENATSIEYGAAAYAFVCNRTNSENVTSCTDSSTYTINAIAPTLTLTLDESSTASQTRTYPNQTNYQASEINSGDSDCTYKKAQNGTIITNGELDLTGTQAYNFTYNVSGCTNYTFKEEEIILTMNQNSSTSDYIWLTIDDAASDKSITYPASDNATGNYTSGVFSSQTITFTLYRNDTVIGTVNGINDTTQLGAAVYNYTYNTSGNVNYTSGEKAYLLTVTQNSTNPITAWLNDSTSDQSGTYGLTVNASVQATYGSTAGTLYIYQNGTQKKTDTDFINYTELSPAAYWVYKFNITGNVNYTSNSTGLTLNFDISKAISSASLEINGSTSDQEFHKNQTINITGSCGNNQQTVTLTGNHTVFGDSFDSETDGTIENVTDVGVDWFPSYDYNNISVNCTANENYTYSEDYSLLNVSADFTLSLNSGVTLSFQPLYGNSTEVQPTGQNSTHGSVCVNVTEPTYTTNGLNVSLFTDVNCTEDYSFEVKADDDGTYVGSTKLTNTSYYRIFTNLTFNDETCFWMWSNYNQSEAGTYNPHLRADSKRYQ